MLDDLKPDAQSFARSLFDLLAPPPDISPSAWSEQNIVLTSAFSAEPGNLRLDRTPWIVEPLDLVADDVTELIVVTGAAQTSKTTLSLCAAGYIADLRPTSILHITPNEALSDTFSSRFNDLIAASATLKAKFEQPRRTGAKANSTTKTFRGGVLSLGAASSPSALSARPAKIVIADEVDRFMHLRKEGDPLMLARARQSTFFGKKLFAISTPTIVGASRIEELYAETDQNVWMVVCPHCAEEHVPVWENVSWTPRDATSATYVTPCCGVTMTDAERWAMGAKGRWQPTATGKPGHRGYRFNGLVSPWVTLQTLVVEWEAAQGKPSLLQPFHNTRLGIAFETETGEGLDEHTIRDLAENYGPATMPAQAALVTAGVDVQAAWLNVEIVAWGDGDEGWALQHHEIPGDPGDPKTWAALEQVLTQTFRHPSGETFAIEAVAIDSGFMTQNVYEFSAQHRARGRRWWATKGMAGQGRPIWQRGGDVARSLARIFVIGTDGGKAQILGGLAQPDGGPGKMHTRKDFPEHWWAWATAEECVTTETPIGTKREWKLKTGQRRNEVLDCLVLALAARYSAEFGIAIRLERLATTGAIRAPQPSMSDLAKRMAAVSGSTP